LLLGALLGAPVAAEEGPRVVQARQRFSEGAELVRRAQWAEALAAFEASARLRPHVVTTYNIGACERALGRYTLARKRFRAALTEGEDDESRLPEPLAQEARGFIAELDRVLVEVEVQLDPPEAAFAVDGRPLELAAPTPRARPVLVADTLEQGPGAPPPAARFTLVVDPGVHLFTLSRKGFTDVVVNRSFPPGARVSLTVALDRLPATLHVGANLPGAVVTVDGLDVGVAPIDVSRPAGSYRVAVRKRGYHLYQTQVQVNAGEEASLRASLVEVRPSVIKKWWFWTAAGAVVAGVALGAYFGARAAATPQLDGGGLGWVVKLR
jgi:hypothetical protein